MTRPMSEEERERALKAAAATVESYTAYDFGMSPANELLLARALLSTSAAERRASPEPTDAELDDLADIIDEHVGEDHLAMERAAWHFVASRLSSAERGMREAAQALNDEVDRMWNDVHRFNPPSWESHQKAICAAQQRLYAALSGIEPGEDEQARGQGRSAPISTDTKGTTK